MAAVGGPNIDSNGLGPGLEVRAGASAAVGGAHALARVTLHGTYFPLDLGSPVAIDDDIRVVLKTYADALRDQDLGAALGCFTTDAAVMAQGAPTAQGPAVRDLYGQIVGAAKLDIAFTVDLILEGERPVAFIHSDGTQTDVSSGSSSTEANREAFVFARQGGELKITHYLFNTRA